MLGAIGARCVDCGAAVDAAPRVSNSQRAQTGALAIRRCDAGTLLVGAWKAASRSAAISARWLLAVLTDDVEDGHGSHLFGSALRGLLELGNCRQDALDRRVAGRVGLVAEPVDRLGGDARLSGDFLHVDALKQG